MQTWVLASNNAGKIREIQAILAPYDIVLKPQADFQVPEIAETGLTFIENALIKARHASACTGLPAVADDSGLCVQAIDGAPGIYSARFAGQGATDAANNRKLLDALADVPLMARQAFYYCAITVMQTAHDATPWICEGQWAGRIMTTPRGDGGFGYDPLFYIDALDKTAAELPLSQKNQISHRGQALQQLIECMQS